MCYFLVTHLEVRGTVKTNRLNGYVGEVCCNPNL